VRARFKDAELPTQRIVLMLAVLVTLVRKLTQWLNADALTFEFIFVADGATQPLAQEEALLAMLFREPIANGTVRLGRVSAVATADELVEERARRSLCQALFVGTAPATQIVDGPDVTQLTIAGPRPRLTTADGVVRSDGEDPWSVWQQSLERLLERWV
jgi:hypothetical protein